jgi:hypothetical protein
MPRVCGDSVAPRGSLGNMANGVQFTAAALPGASGNPCVPFNSESGTPVTIMFKTTVTTTITIYYSPDGVNWYITTTTLTLTVSSGSITGVLDIVTGAQYLAFASSGTNAVITATAQAK